MALKNKNLIIIGVLAVIVLVLASVSYKFNKEKTYEDIIKEVKVSSYSLSGKITSIDKDGFMIQAGWVEKNNNENVFVQYERRVVINSTTHVYLVTLSSRSVVTDAMPGYFKAGEAVVIYTTDNPKDNEMLNATRIDVNRSK